MIRLLTNYYITSIFIHSSSQTKEERRLQPKSVGEKVSGPFETLLVKRRREERDGRIIHGTRSREQSSPSENVGDSPRIRENFGTIKSPQKEAPPDERQENKRSGGNIGDPRRDRTKQRRQLLRKRLRKFADHFGDSSKKSQRHPKRKGTSILERIPQVNVHVGHG